MSRCNVIVVGASAGGVEALLRLVADLPGDLDATVAVALHTPEHSPSALPSILSRHGALPAAHAGDGEPLLHGRIYVAPPGRHLLVKRRTVRVVNGPHENGHRPAVDPLFRTAARAHGPRVIGVILSGSLDDGTAGLASIKAMGGASLVQDPRDAMFDGMPSSAIENVPVDLVGPVDAIARELVRRIDLLSTNQVEDSVPEESEDELDIVEMDRGVSDPDTWDAAPSQFTCPECHGSLWELKDGALVRFRCRTGHAFGPETLASEQSHYVEEALFTALRALEENASLLRRLHARANERGHKRTAARFLSQMERVEMRAGIIREALNRGGAAVVA
jgi:two-component system, chemotaxis family, protein-glutamate methylesterase/glutaminase